MPTKWIKFAAHLLKIKDIDYFCLDYKVKSITCAFHQGMSYQVIHEDFYTEDLLLSRYENICNLLGIENEMASFSGEARREETGEEKLLGLLDAVGDATALD